MKYEGNPTRLHITLLQDFPTCQSRWRRSTIICAGLKSLVKSEKGWSIIYLNEWMSRVLISTKAREIKNNCFVNPKQFGCMISQKTVSIALPNRAVWLKIEGKRQDDWSDMINNGAMTMQVWSTQICIYGGNQNWNIPRSALRSLHDTHTVH